MKANLANPYIVGNPIKSREMFFGREDDFKYVARKIGEGHTNQIIVLCGERRSGKTSILFQILSGRLGESFLPILIDMQMLAGIKSDIDFFKSILRSGYAGLRDAGIELEHPHLEQKHQSAEYLMESFLTRVMEHAAGKIMLFLLDEYELIEAKIRDGTLSQSTIHYLSGILESSFRVSFIFTGSTNLEDRDPEVWKTLFAKSVYRKISYLSHRDTERLITEPLKGILNYPHEVVETIWRLSGGQPFFTQVICQNVVDHLIDRGDVNLTMPDTQRTIQDIVTNPLPQMIYSWNSFAKNDQLILSALAGRLDDAEDRADARRVLHFIRKNRLFLSLDRENTSALLEDAYHREFLVKDEADAYRFRMDIFRHWIRREHSIWRVVNETGFSSARKLRKIGFWIAGCISGLALLFLSWLFILPRILPDTAEWARSVSLLPEWTQEKSDEDTIPAHTRYVSFKSTQGPFTLVIDGMYTHRSEDSLIGSKWIVLPSLPSGKHDFVATLPSGEKSEILGAMVSPTVNTFTFLFSPEESNMRVQTLKAKKLAKKDMGTLIVETVPPGATVLIGNENRGLTPLELNLMAGFYPVWIIMTTYESISIQTEIQPEKAQRWVVELEEAKTVLAFDIQRNASVYLDGDHLSDLPTVIPWPVRSGRHVMVIENREQNFRREIELNLLPGEVVRIDETTK